MERNSPYKTARDAAVTVLQFLDIFENCIPDCGDLSDEDRRQTMVALVEDTFLAYEHCRQAVDVVRFDLARLHGGLVDYRGLIRETSWHAVASRLAHARLAALTLWAGCDPIPQLCTIKSQSLVEGLLARIEREWSEHGQIVLTVPNDDGSESEILEFDSEEIIPWLDRELALADPSPQPAKTARTKRGKVGRPRATEKHVEWFRMLQSGEYGSQAELAASQEVDPSTVSKALKRLKDNEDALKKTPLKKPRQ